MQDQLKSFFSFYHIFQDTNTSKMANVRVGHMSNTNKQQILLDTSVVLIPQILILHSGHMYNTFRHSSKCDKHPSMMIYVSLGFKGNITSFTALLHQIYTHMIMINVYTNLEVENNYLFDHKQVNIVNKPTYKLLVTNDNLLLHRTQQRY